MMAGDILYMTCFVGVSSKYFGHQKLTNKITASSFAAKLPGRHFMHKASEDPFRWSWMLPFLRRSEEAGEGDYTGPVEEWSQKHDR